MQTRLLRTLATIADVESFSTAATQLNMTLSAVSMQMKALEETLDIELFDRSFRPPRLTPLGRAIASKATDVLKSEAELIRSCVRQDELVGRFQIGFIPTASVRLLPAFLKIAERQAPRARFELETGLSEALEEKVYAGTLFAAVITASTQPKPGVRYDVLRKEPLKFAVPGEFGDLAIDELIEELTFLQFTPGSGIGKLIEQHMSRLARRKRRAGTLILDSVEAIVECVNAGLGFTLLSEEDIARYSGPGIRMMDTAAGLTFANWF